MREDKVRNEWLREMRGKDRKMRKIREKREGESVRESYRIRVEGK